MFRRPKLRIKLTKYEQIGVHLGFHHKKKLDNIRNEEKRFTLLKDKLTIAESLMRKQLLYGIKFMVAPDGNSIIFREFNWKDKK